MLFSHNPIVQSASVDPGGFILDDIAGTADFAFSASRYLASAFVGSAVIQLREDNTDTTQDFKIVSDVLVTDDISEDAVATWLTANSASNAFAAKFYDQTGSGRDIQQTTLANQPLYVASWTNGRGAVQNTAGTLQYMTTVSGFTAAPTAGVSAYFACEQLNAVPSNTGMFGDPNATTFSVGTSLQKAQYFADNGQLVFTTSDITLAPHQLSFESPSGSGAVTCTIRVDGTEDANASLDNDIRNGTWVMFNKRASPSTTSERYYGIIGEMIFANDDFSTGDRDLIEASQSAFYATP